jgi:hypothetical protein
VKAYVEKHQLYEVALETFHESDKLPVRVVLLDQSLQFTNTPQEILSLYGEWFFERREFDQSALGMGDIIAPHLCSLMGCSIYGCAATRESNACIRKGAFMARTLRSRAASKGRSRGNRCNCIPCGRYALRPQGHVGTNDCFTEDLGSKKRYTEAGQVLLDYAEDVREAVIILVQGSQFSEARRIVS